MSIFDLDGVTDPHHLGACLRAAHLAGAIAVIAQKDHSAILNEVALQVSSGAGFITPYLRVVNLARTLRKFNYLGVCTVGTVVDVEKTIYDIPSYDSYAWVMGSEGSGLRRLTRESCEWLARIPTKGEIDSLNVSVASGICLFSHYCQRKNCD